MWCLSHCHTLLITSFYLFFCIQYQTKCDWIEQCLTSTPTQYRLSGRQFYRSKDPTNSIKVPKEKTKCDKITVAKTHGEWAGMGPAFWADVFQNVNYMSHMHWCKVQIDDIICVKLNVTYYIIYLHFTPLHMWHSSHFGRRQPRRLDPSLLILPAFLQQLFSAPFSHHFVRICLFSVLY